MLPRVRVVATGGTIASTPGEDGAVPSLSGEDLLEAVPHPSSHADVSAESVAQVRGSTWTSRRWPRRASTLATRSKQGTRTPED